MTSSRRPRFQRAENPPAIRFQLRDEKILQAIQDFDGVVARRHIQELFWPKHSSQAMQSRLSKLYHNGYISWPSREQHNNRPIPEPIIWLGWRGILCLAGIRGIQIQYPKRINENQLRRLQSSLRKHDVRWLREPNWLYLAHDLSVIDFRLAVQRSLENQSILDLDTWIPESQFRSQPDRVKFSYIGNNGKVYEKVKGVIPDGSFVIVNREREFQGKPASVRFFIEMDMGTHDNGSFGIEKAGAGAAYIKSKEFKDRFGGNSGRWLIVTTGVKRMKNLIKQTKYRAKDHPQLFYFTTLDQVDNNNVLHSPIWWQIDKPDPVALPFLMT